LETTKGFRESELRKITRILEAREAHPIEAWNETE